MTPASAYVASVRRHSGWTDRDTSTRWRLVSRHAISAASTSAVAPSYMLALATSIPVRAHTIDWYS